MKPTLPSCSVISCSESCSSIKIHGETSGVDYETNDGQYRPSSPVMSEQNDVDEYSPEDIAGTEELPLVTDKDTAAKKKKAKNAKDAKKVKKAASGLQP